MSQKTQGQCTGVEFHLGGMALFDKRIWLKMYARRSDFRSKCNKNNLQGFFFNVYCAILTIYVYSGTSCFPKLRIVLGLLHSGNWTKPSSVRLYVSRNPHSAYRTMQCYRRKCSSYSRTSLNSAVHPYHWTHAPLRSPPQLQSSPSADICRRFILHSCQAFYDRGHKPTLRLWSKS